MMFLCLNLSVIEVTNCMDSSSTLKCSKIASIVNEQDFHLSCQPNVSIFNIITANNKIV